MNTELWSSETLKARVRALRIAVEGAGLSALLTSDLSDIRYLTGFFGGRGFLLVTPRQVHIWTDLRHHHRARGLSPELVDVVGEVSSDDVAIPPKVLVERLPEIDGRLGVEPETAGQPLWKELVARFGEDVTEAPPLIKQMRAVKAPAEVEAIRRAVRLSEQARERALAGLSRGMTEWRLALDLEAAALELGADRLGFPAMVAFGPRSAEPQATPTHRRIEADGWLLFDWGCACDGYVCDMARTVHVGPPTDQEREDYACVREALEAGMEAVKPGVRAKDVDAAVRRVFERRDRAGLFTHHAGHSVGLGPFEPPILHPRSGWILREGYVLSIEVGLYRHGTGGIRLEQQVLLRRDGIEILSGVLDEETPVVLL